MSSPVSILKETFGYNTFRPLQQEVIENVLARRDTLAVMHSSFKPVLINGQRVLIGGDVITAIDGKSVANFDDLQAYLQNAKPGQQVKLTILRDSSEQTLTATLAKHP